MLKCTFCGSENDVSSGFCTSCGKMLTPGTGKLPMDTVLEDRYVIVKTLGKGGMGAVYQACDLRLENALVAVKEMSTRAVGEDNLEESIEAFKKEARMLINLSHTALPHITDFFSVGEDRWYLVMDYIEGKNLKEIVDERGPIPEKEVIDWTKQICNILMYLHSQSPPVIFRDLKPSNIMLTKEGTIKLIDFGIARHFKPGIMVDTTAYGSHGFSPPEQYGEKQTDVRSDLYSLGATMHFVLTGMEPNSANPFDFRPPSEIVTVSSAFEVALMKTLELKPENRPQSVKDFRAMLDTIEDETNKTQTLLLQEDASGESTTRLLEEDKETKQNKKTKKRKKKGKFALAIIVLLLLCGGGWWAADNLGLIETGGVNDVKAVISSSLSFLNGDPADENGAADVQEKENKDEKNADKSTDTEENSQIVTADTNDNESSKSSSSNEIQITSSKQLLTEIYDDFTGTLSDYWDLSCRYSDWSMDSHRGAYAETDDWGYLALNLDNYINPRNYTIECDIYYDSGDAGVFVKGNLNLAEEKWSSSNEPPTITLDGYYRELQAYADDNSIVRTEIDYNYPYGDFYKMKVVVKEDNVDVYMNDEYKFSTALSENAANYGRFIGIVSGYDSARDNTTGYSYIRSFKLTNNDTAEDLNKSLFYRCVEGDMDEVKALLVAGADVNFITDGSMPLMGAVWNEHTDLVRLLLSVGADINGEKSDGSNALHYAAIKNNKEILKALLARGIELNEINLEGRTALMYAAEEGSLETARILLAAGADPGIVNESGDTALSLATENWHTDIQDLLSQAGAEG